MASLGVTIKEISIKEACIRHFKDIDHDMTVHDVTYENSQARERTQILMDVANRLAVWSSAQATFPNLHWDGLLTMATTCPCMVSMPAFPRHW